jgi:hypothetical protein
MRAIVIKPDGVVPFDEGLHPEHRRLMLGDLVEMGHTLTHYDEPHPLHGGQSHAVLHSGPHSKAEQDARRAEAAKAKPVVAASGKRVRS